MTRSIWGRVLAGLAGLGLLAGLAGCARNQYPLTECQGGAPVIARTLDVAPPNCGADAG